MEGTCVWNGQWYGGKCVWKGHVYGGNKGMDVDMGLKGTWIYKGQVYGMGQSM